MKIESFKVSSIDVKENIGPLYALDARVSRAAPALLPFETEKKLLAFLTKENDSETWLWEDQDGSFVAYISLIDKPEESVMEVLRICVDPDLQRRGIGKLMMKFAEKVALERRRKKMDLLTNPENRKAMGFYKGLGYRIASLTSPNRPRSI